MKQKLLIKTMLLLLCLIVGGSSAWGEDKVLTFSLTSNPGGWPTTNSSTEASYTYTLNDANYTFKLKNVKCNSGYLMTYYIGSVGLPAIKDYKLTKVIASNSGGCSTSTKVGISSSSSSASYIDGGAIQTWSKTSSAYTYNLTSTEASTVYYLYVTNKNAQITSLELTYTKTGGGDNTPYISAPDVDIAYNDENGSIEYDVTNGEGIVSASLTTGSDWLTLGTVIENEVPFTCSANTTTTARTATVTLSYTGADNKVVTVTQDGRPNYISEITATSTAYTIVGTVVAKNNRGFVTGDGTGYVYTYLNAAPTQSVGDKVKIAGTTGTYGQIIQFTSGAKITTESTSAYDGTPAATVINAVPDYSTGLHLSTYLQFEGKLEESNSNYYITVGSDQIQISYPTTTQSTALSALDGKNVRVKGYFSGINSSSNFSVMLESVEEVTTPIITVDPTTSQAFTYVAGNGPSADQMFTVTGTNLVSADITATVSGDYEITDNTDYSSSVTIASGDIVSVRLKAGLAKGEHNGTLTLSSTDATDVVINLSGTVTGQTYTIEQYTTPATAHGTITFSPSSPVEDGTEVTLSAEPAEGYTFTADSWVIYKQSGEDYVVDNSVTVTDSKIVMPAYAIYVDAAFAPIAVTGVTLNKTKATIGIDDTETLTATIAPANAKNKTVTWESSNTDVATVANGVVTGVAEGTTTITATTEDGSFIATCDVTVMNAVVFDCSSDTETSKNGVSFECSDISSSDGFKFYKSSSTTFSVTNGVIKKIEFTCTASGTTKYGPGCFGDGAPSGYAYSGTVGTWEGSATSVSFTATDNQVRATKIKVFIATTATPTFTVAEGEYDEVKNVELSCATDGATIYYTTNGDTPTSSSTEYTGGISITETTTLKAIAVKDEVASAVASATYTMNRPAAPTFDVAAFVFDAAFDVHLSTETDGATIYYTTDGSTPTNSSNEYTDKGISINTGSDVTVKAIAFKSGLTSDVANVTYTFDARVTPTFSLTTTSLNLKVNDASDAVTVTTNSDGEVTFTCEDAHVTLTGTGNSRTISANAAGTYTVNVSLTGSATYKDAAGTITVTVTKKATTMVISNVFDDGLDLHYAHGGVTEGIVKYNDVALNPQPTVTFTSSDEKVATVDEEGNIAFKKAGTTTITASYAGDDEYEASNATYVLDLIDTTPQAIEVDITLNNTFFGCTAFTSWTTGMATSLSGETKNVTVTYGKGTSGNMYCNSEKVRFYSNNTFTIDAPIGYNIISVDMNVSITSATPSGNVSSDTWTGNASSVSFTFANKTDITSISVTLAPVVTLNKYGYATYCSPYPIDFSKAEGFTAWRVSDVSADGTITFSKITETIKEGQGVLLYNKDADVENKTTVTLPVGESEGATEFTTSENKLVGITEPTAIAADQYFGLSGNKFVKVNAGTVPAGKALLPANAITNAARELTFVFEGETTGIRGIENSELRNEKSFFDLQGRKVAQPKKGLYIMNGKKVIMK